MVLLKGILVGFLLLVLAFGAPSQADTITLHIEGTVTQNLTEEPKWAPLLETPVGTPVVASFEIDTVDIFTTIFPLVTLREPLQGLIFNPSVKINGTDFSGKFVTSEPLLFPGTVSVLRAGPFSLGVEETLGTAVILPQTARWETMKIDFGLGFPETVAGVDLRDLDVTSDDGLFGNSSVFYTAGPVIDGERQTDTWQSIIFAVKRIYAARHSNNPAAAVEGK
ncbi:MAG: hypothetical protein GKS02_06975 [Alphaproteobacteria bacterium]|nr:hypothetical protein [Alphaproteobacteria bacterium]